MDVLLTVEEQTFGDNEYNSLRSATHSAAGQIFAFKEFLEVELPSDPVCPSCGQSVGLSASLS